MEYHFVGHGRSSAMFVRIIGMWQMPVPLVAKMLVWICIVGICCTFMMGVLFYLSSDMLTRTSFHMCGRWYSAFHMEQIRMKKTYKYLFKRAKIVFNSIS